MDLPTDSGGSGALVDLLKKLVMAPLVSTCSWKSVTDTPSRVRWKLERSTILATRPTATSTASALEASSPGATLHWRVILENLPRSLARSLAATLRVVGRRPSSANRPARRPSSQASLVLRAGRAARRWNLSSRPRLAGRPLATTWGDTYRVVHSTGYIKIWLSQT